MIKTFEANPNTSCGSRPRLRRDLDHAERQEESCVFTLGPVWSVHLALWALELITKTLQAAVRDSHEAAWTLQRLPGGDNWLPTVDAQKPSKIAAETLRERSDERSEPQDAAGEA